MHNNNPKILRKFQIALWLFHFTPFCISLRLKRILIVVKPFSMYLWAVWPNYGCLGEVEFLCCPSGHWSCQRIHLGGLICRPLLPCVGHKETSLAPRCGQNRSAFNGCCPVAKIWNSASMLQHLCSLHHAEAVYNPSTQDLHRF